MLFSLPCHLTEPGCRLSGEALQGSGRCLRLLRDPTHQVDSYLWMSNLSRTQCADLLPLIITIHISPLEVYLWTLLHHLVFKPQESFLNFGIIQREWQEVREGLLFPETLDEDLNSSDRRRDCSFLGTCDNCQANKERWEKIFSFSGCSLTCFMMLLLILTYLSFHSLFWDAYGRLCVKLQTSACLSFFPNDVSVE